ncbi:MAG: DUF3179 domain-containing protein [Gemmatimonadales bacterium]
MFLKLRLAACAMASTMALAPLAHVYAQTPSSIPSVDLSKHSVPLDEVYFDTFRRTANRAVPLTEADTELILRLRDAIPPLHSPRYESARRARWLKDEDVVIGYASSDSAWAFPIRILNFHEIVNDTLAGEPVLISYCPLCMSGVVFSRRVGDRTLTFGNTSALYESDMVMLDYETGSYWWQVAGKAIVGTLTDTRLTVLPGVTMQWAEWVESHPDTRVLSRETGYSRNYDRNPFSDYRERVNRGGFSFPVSKVGRDTRLDAGQTVLTVKLGDAVRAYPLGGERRVAVNDTLGDSPILVLVDGRGGGAAYTPILAGRKLTFRVRRGEFRDRQTDSRWDSSGVAVEGELRGQRLRQLPSRTSLWFAIVAVEPGITVYRGLVR